jgi:hypothetical protein
MLNGWDERRGDGEESAGSLSQGGLSDKFSSSTIEKIPDCVVLSRRLADAETNG